MMKYIVTWVLTTYFSVPCPTSSPVPDEYGREPEYSLMITVACMDSKADTLKKEFTDRKTALAFIEKGQRENIVFGSTGQLSNFKLDSIKVKKTKT